VRPRASAVKFRAVRSIIQLVPLKNYPPEIRPYIDRRGNRSLRQLTNQKCHHHHLHFTNSGWWDNNKKLLFSSDRGGRTNLYSIELATGQIAQHTDSDQPPETPLLFASVNPKKPEAYLWRGNNLVAVDLIRSGERQIYRAEAKWIPTLTSVTADARFVTTSLYDNLSDRFPVDLFASGAGFTEYFEARPESKIIAVPIEGGPAKELHKDRNWIGFTLASPTQPHLIVFRHIGPPERVEQPLFGLDLRGGKPWQIRPKKHPAEKLTSIHWHADGESLAYHLQNSSGQHFLGSIRYDNQQPREIPLPTDPGHIHCNSLELIVADHRPDTINRLIRLYRVNYERLEGPRILAEHRASFNVQQLHAHPRLSPDNKKVIFTSDRTGYAQIYEAEIMSFDTLPVQ
jgi:oligogalacturonide lyase